MPFDSLSQYIGALENAGELRRVKTIVSPHLEIAEIMRRLMYKGEQPAILFENVEGYEIPVLGNAFGTINRIKIALQTEDFTEIGERIVDLTKMKIPHGIFNKLKLLPKLSELSEYGPQYV